MAMDVKQLKKEILALSHEDKKRLMELIMPKLQPEMMADREFVARMMPRCFGLMRQMHPDLVANMRAMMDQEEAPARAAAQLWRGEDIQHPE